MSGAFVLVAILNLAGPAAPRADDGTARAVTFYKSGVKLFEAGQHEQALVEFQRSYETKPVPATLFMMAQCEYYTGALKEARAHYERYVKESPSDEFVDVAKDRIQSIDRRKSVFAINTIPESVDVAIVAPDGKVVASGRAPNTFAVVPGTYRIKLTKPSYQPLDVPAEIDVVETKPLFFPLQPIPGRLEIVTVPPGAALFINGNRAQNPYRQDVPPGRYEIYAEAPEHHAVSLAPVEIGPGERKVFDAGGSGPIELAYVQRSGRIDLLWWSAGLGVVMGAGSVLGVLSDPDPKKVRVASGALLLGGGLLGAGVGFVSSSLVVPKYIPDNRAAFVIGGMWMGIVEGAAVGLTVRPDAGPAAFGAAAGLAGGTTAAALLSHRAPTYGRVWVMQSAAIMGALGGMLLKTSLEIRDDKLGPMLLGGLNAGLLTGLGIAYLPDQTRYGPTWTRVLLVDLAAGAGALLGALGATVQECQKPDAPSGCDFASAPSTARLALAGGLLGLGAGILLTRNVERKEADSPVRPTVPPTAFIPMPMPTLMAVEGPRGMSAVPGVAAVGRF